MTDDVSTLIDRALASEDEAWVGAERAVLDAVSAGGSPEAGLAHPDPMGRLLAITAQERASTSDDDPMRKASTYLDAIETRAARSIMRVPSAVGASEVLSRAFGPRLATALALRLVQQPGARPWRVLTTLAYLDRHKDPTTTEAVVRFAARTSVPKLQQVAVQVLRNLGDSALASKVDAERRRLASTGGQLPAALASLGSPGPTTA